jgi:hypothetical protein
MENKYNHKKEATPFAVASAKMPPWFFAKLEGFRYDNELQTRNAAVNILLMLALSLLGDFNQDECLEFIGDQGMTEIPDSMTKVLSLAKGAV